MYKWIEQDGRTAIISRDLSWVSPRDTQLLELLIRKAEARELTIVVPSHTDLTRNLEAAGAEIVTYPTLS